MFRNLIRKWCWALLPFWMIGCLHPVAQTTDQILREVSASPVDRMPILAAEKIAPVSAATFDIPDKTPPAFAAPVGTKLEATRDAIRGEGLVQASVAAKADPKPPVKGPKRLDVPPELPGAGAPRVVLPPTTAPAKEREVAFNKLFPPLPPLPTDAEPIAGPNGQPLTLADLQSLALNHNALIRQAAADVEAAKGAAIQAGAYPNPVVGWAQDEVGTSHHGPSELGMFIGQTFVLGGKLTLARAMAKIDVHNAELALKRAQADLAGQVRANYFAVLVARKNLQVSRTLARFTDEIYRVQVDQVKLTQAAPYEPRQLRVFALQARNSLTAARNRDAAAWQQLTATLGMAKMPATKLVGSVDMPVPVLRYEAVRARMLKEHTDVLTAQNGDLKARIAVQKARAMVIPDVTLNMHMNKFFSENGYVHSLDVQFPLPIYDRNKGGIMQAQGNLVRAVEEPRRVHADLSARLADAFERYHTNRQILEAYRDHILADQMEAYLGAYERHQQEPDKVGFGDVAAAQQALATTITSYVSTLGNLWQAVADVSTLMQTNDLFQVEQNEQWPAIPDLDGKVSRTAR